MSEKKFEIAYSDEAKKVIGPIGFTSLLNSGLLGDVRKVVLCMYDKLDDGIYEHIIEVAKEQGCGSLFAIDKQALAAKLCRLEPKEIIVHGYRPGRAVNSLSYTCPTCGAHIGRYPFCKYCGQALELEVESDDEE